MKNFREKKSRAKCKIRQIFGLKWKTRKNVINIDMTSFTSSKRDDDVITGVDRRRKYVILLTHLRWPWDWVERGKA